MTVLPQILRDPVIKEVFNGTKVDESLYFVNTFPTSEYYETILRWLVYTGSTGLAPIIARGTQSPEFRGGGTWEAWMQGLLISEKFRYSELDVNAAKSTDPVKAKIASNVLLEQIEELKRRNDRRRDWLFSQVFFNAGKISYRDDEGSEFDVDYQMPPTHYIADLGLNREWGVGSARDPIGDINTGVKRIVRDAGAKKTDIRMFITSGTLAQRLQQDANIRTELQANAFGGAQPSLLIDPVGALTTYFGVEIVEFDDVVPITLMVESQIDASNYVVTNAHLATPGSEVKFYRIDRSGQSRYQEELGVIASVSGSQITLENPLVQAWNRRGDKVQASVPYLPENRVVLAAQTAMGRPTMEWLDGPIGLNSTIGMASETWESKEPDVVFTRAQRYGIPAWYNTQSTYTIDVG